MINLSNRILTRILVLVGLGVFSIYGTGTIGVALKNVHMGVWIIMTIFLFLVFIGSKLSSGNEYARKFAIFICGVCSIASVVCGVVVYHLALYLPPAGQPDP